MLFPLVTSMYVSRILLDDGTGTVAYGQNISSYFVILASFGMSVYGVREIARVKDDKQKRDVLFSELFSLNLITTAVSSGAFILLVVSIKSFREDYLLFLSCGIQVFMNAFNIDWLYQGCEDYGYIAKRSIIVKFFSLPCPS